MLPRAVRRLSRFNYEGTRCYFVTILTKQRPKYFVDAEVVETCRTELLRAAVLRDFEILAACFMPDHVHMLVEGRNAKAKLGAFMKLAKQLSGYHAKRCHAIELWAKGYHDRIVRQDEDPGSFVSYIRQNPVKARLVEAPELYPFLWIDRRFWDRQLARPSGRASRNNPAATGGRSCRD